MKRSALGFQKRNWVLFLTCLLLSFQSACDSDVLDDHKIELLPVSPTNLALSNGPNSVTMLGNGIFQRLGLIPNAAKPNRVVAVDGSYGLWVAGTQNGTKSNVMTPLFGGRIDGFELKPSIADGGGLFYVDKTDFQTGFKSWPADLGAPTSPDGSPKMNGDVMAWGSFSSASTTGSSGNSFSGLHIVVNPYMFEGVDLKSTLFIRFEISNESSSPIENLHLGFGGDIDLYLRDTADPNPLNGVCGQFKTHWNNTGYDLNRNYSYTYVKPDPADGDIPPECYGTLVGYSIVGSTSTNGLMTPALAHTVVKRWEEEPFEAYQESKIRTPSQVLFALQGLSSEGMPMVSPATGEITKFAYSGNPIMETGWVDYRNDVRSLQSISPFTLAPGEKVVTIVIVFTVGSPTFEQGIADLSAQFDKTMALRGMWDN